MPKRPQVDPTPITKTRVRGPQYIGPHLSDSDETSDDEADFEKFKMFTRIAKIVEFHHAAAMADIDLALSICNGRKTKQLGKLEEEVQVTEHEKRMLELQTTKENERKAIVSAERKKRRDELRNRSILRDPIEATDVAKYDALFDPSTFKIDVDTNGVFVLKREETSNKVTENLVNGLSPRSSHMPAPEMLRARMQSIGRDTPSVAPGMQSGWKSKPAASTLSQVHAVYDDEPASAHIPQLKVDTTWSSTAVNSFAHSVSQDNMDFPIPGGFPLESKARGNSVTSAWGNKPSPAIGLASGSPGKPLILGSTTQPKEDETPIIAAKEISRISPPVEAERASPITSSSKKPNKKQRQANKKPGGASSSSSNKGEVELSSTPSAPSSSSRLAAAPHVNMSQANINGSSAAEEEELSSTPRPSFAHIMMMKKQGLASGMTRGTPVIRADDPASTPRHSALRQLTTTHDPNESTAEEMSPWERMQRKKSDPHGAESSKQAMSMNRDVKQKSKVLDHHSSDPSIPSTAEEETPWNQMMRLKAQGQAPQGKMSKTTVRPQTAEEEEETPWQRAMRLKEQNKAPTSTGVVPSNEQDETPWERATRLKGQSQIPSSANSSSTKFITPDAESSWERMDMTSQQRGQHPNTHAFPIPPPIRREQRVFWQPGVTTPITTQRQMWNPGPTQSPHIEKATSMAVPNGRTQEANRVRRMSDPVSPSPRLEFANLPDGDRQEFVPTSILKGTKSKQSSAKNKKVTIEEIPDDEGSTDVKLPSNSRYVLDIVEPKPSVPSNMYTRFFDFEAGEDDDTESSSFAMTPSTAPTSPPGEIPSLDDDELMEEIKSGGWEKLLTDNPSKLPQNAKHARWTTDSRTSDSPSLQTFDSAKLLSALESVNGGLSMENNDASPKPVPSNPSVPNIKDNKDAIVKPTKEAKGKAKGKGADKKGKSGGRK